MILKIKHFKNAIRKYLNTHNKINMKNKYLSNCILYFFKTSKHAIVLNSMH